jgi:hypothetical protein
MYLEGTHSMADVGKEFGVSRQRVHQILNREGVQERWLKQKNKDKADLEKYGELIERSMERYRQGEHLFVVAKELGVPHRVMERFAVRTAEDVIDHEQSKFYSLTKVGTVPEGFDTPCLEWFGNYANNSSPRYSATDSERSARKWSWFYKHGELVGVRQVCGNVRCVETTHMVKK